MQKCILLTIPNGNTNILRRQTDIEVLMALKKLPNN